MICQMNTLAQGAFSAIAAASSPLAGGDLYPRFEKTVGPDENRSIVLDESREALRRNLCDCWASAMNSGWDGYDAAPLPYETLQNALAFASTLPWNANAPELAPESDGCISFDWYLDEYNQLSVSVDADGLVSYAARVGGDSLFGNYRLDGTHRMPEGMRMSMNSVAA